MYDMLHSYTVPWLTSGGLTCLASIIMCTIVVKSCNRCKHQSLDIGDSHDYERANSDDATFTMTKFNTTDDVDPSSEKKTFGQSPSKIDDEDSVTHNAPVPLWKIVEAKVAQSIAHG